MRRLVYYVAASIDGFIADESGETSVFPVDPRTLADLFERYPETCPAHLCEALGVTGPPRRFGAVLMGYRTHAPALEVGLTSAYPHLRQVVATHRSIPADPTVEVVSGELGSYVARLKQESGGDIWLCGGGELAGQLVDEIDELQIKVNPVTLHSGVPLFAGGVPRRWDLVSVEAIPGDVALVTYRAR